MSTYFWKNLYFTHLCVNWKVGINIFNISIIKLKQFDLWCVYFYYSTYYYYYLTIVFKKMYTPISSKGFQIIIFVANLIPLRLCMLCCKCTKICTFLITSIVIQTLKQRKTFSLHPYYVTISLSLRFVRYSMKFYKNKMFVTFRNTCRGRCSVGLKTKKKCPPVR